jgi:serine/threonine protein kinase
MWDIGREPDLPFSRIGAYEIHRFLGGGSMANVYEGRHTQTGRLAAVKVMHQHLAHDRVATARFLREARALSRVVHPNLAKVFDVGEQGAPYFAMTLIEGEDLTEYMRRLRPMSMKQIAECMLPVIDAVAAAHDAGVVHRDLKPSNIRLAHHSGGSIAPKVLDFGISKLQEDGTTSELTESGAALGTVSYMSPEQLRSAKRADGRSDIYALGAILYECATGVRPFHGEGAYELMHAILTSRLVPPSFLRPELSPSFDALVVRAMARDPSDRFQSARELGAELTAFLLHSYRSKDTLKSRLGGGPEKAGAAPRHVDALHAVGCGASWPGIVTAGHVLDDAAYSRRSKTQNTASCTAHASFERIRPAPEGKAQNILTATWHVGRLVELRLTGNPTMAEVHGFEVAARSCVGTCVVANKNKVVVCTDFRAGQILRPEVGDALVKLMQSENRHVERNGVLAHESPIVGLQASRLLNEASREPRRRLFTRIEPLCVWLGEALGENEVNRLHEFYREGNDPVYREHTYFRG